MIKGKHEETILVINLYDDNDNQVGFMEIEPDKHELSRLSIWKPYQNKGYGYLAVKKAIEDYNVNSLWVRSDNEKAITLYELFDFMKDGEVMFQMKRSK